jgi:hypothetical protein
MAAAILTLALAFLCGGGLWLGLGPKLELSGEAEQNELLNLVVYVGAAVPLAFVVVFFLLGADG